MVFYDENRAGNLRRQLEPHRVWDRGRAESDLWVIGARETRFDLRLTRETLPCDLLAGGPRRCGWRSSAVMRLRAEPPSASSAIQCAEVTRISSVRARDN